MKSEDVSFSVAGNMFKALIEVNIEIKSSPLCFEELLLVSRGGAKVGISVVM